MKNCYGTTKSHLFIFLCVMGMLVYGCLKKPAQVQVLENGTSITWFKKEDGKKIKEGDFIVFNAIISSTIAGEMVNSYNDATPMTLIVTSPQHKGDMNDAFSFLARGDSAQIELSIDSMYKMQGQQIPDSIKGSIFTNQLKIEEVIHKDLLSDEEFKTKINNYMDQIHSKQKKVEFEKLEKYISDNKLAVQTLESGLRYIIDKEGKGRNPKKGDKVKIHYVGKLLNGTVFDTSLEKVAKDSNIYNPQNPYKPLEFELGSGKVIPGWEQAILLLKKGTKARIYIPSDLAYGPKGIGPIPGFSTLIFELELIDF